jgi:hypothetical protein
MDFGGQRRKQGVQEARRREAVAKVFQLRESEVYC